MPNRISDAKKQISLVLERETIEKLDREAGEKGTSRTAIIATAIAEYFEKDRALELLSEKVDKLSVQQTANAAAIIEAVRSQPIAIAEAKQEALPEPEPEEEYEKTWFGLYRKKKKV